jgi:hypothetical protein
VQDKRILRRAAVEGLRDLKTLLRELSAELSAELVEPSKQNLEASRMIQSECERMVKEAWERMLWQRERGRETVYARRVRRMLARAFVDFCDSVVRVMEQSSWQWARLYRLHQLHVAVQDVQVERRQERERERARQAGRCSANGTPWGRSNGKRTVDAVGCLLAAGGGGGEASCSCSCMCLSCMCLLSMACFSSSVSAVGAITGPLSIYLLSLTHSLSLSHTQQHYQQQQLEHQTELLTARSDLFVYQVSLGLCFAILRLCSGFVQALAAHRSV